MTLSASHHRGRAVTVGTVAACVTGIVVQAVWLTVWERAQEVRT